MNPEPYKDEVWKDVTDYEGLYQVSNYGRLKALPRFIERGNRFGTSSNIMKGEHILSPKINKHGYIRNTLTKDGLHKSYFVHRLVAVAFIDNILNFPYINHKDENKSNNRVENLEWCTAKYNSNYGTIKERLSIKNRDSGNIVFQYDKNGVYIKSYRNSKEALRCLYKRSGGIIECCKNGRICHGFYWRLKKDGYKEGINIIPAINKRLTPVIQLNKEGKELNRFKSIAEASRVTGIPATSIYNGYIKNHYAYGYKFVSI